MLKIRQDILILIEELCHRRNLERFRGNKNLYFYRENSLLKIRVRHRRN